MKKFKKERQLYKEIGVIYIEDSISSSVMYIINNKSRMTGGQKQADNAVKTWIRIKLNNP